MIEHCKQFDETTNAQINPVMAAPNEEKTMKIKLTHSSLFSLKYANLIFRRFSTMLIKFSIISKVC